MPSRIELDELRRRRDAGAQVVEVLPDDEYRWAHIPGALHLPLKQLDAETTRVLDRARDVVVYCHDYLWDLSPRAACRLETLGFEHVFDYVPGKVDWMANALPVEGEFDASRTAGALAQRDVVTCGLEDRVGDVRERVERSPYGYGLVVHDGDLVLGRLRMSAMRDAGPDARAADVMSPGPSTVRADLEPEKLAERLDKRGFATAVVTTPEGRLIGVIRRGDLNHAT